MKTYKMTFEGQIEKSQAAQMAKTFSRMDGKKAEKFIGTDTYDIEQELDMYCDFRPVAQFRKIDNTRFEVFNLEGDTEFKITINII